MNGKRLLTLAAFAAIAMTAIPASAVVPPQNITVKWNTQAVGSLALATNYSATGAQGLGAPAIALTNNGGSGLCTATGSGSEVASTVNFGSVTPDGVKYTDCMYENGVTAAVVTSDSAGYNLAEKATAGYPTPGFLLCLLPNGTFANNLAVTQSGRAGVAPSIVSTSACPGGDFLMDTTGATLLTSAAQTASTNLGGDVELVLAPNATSGAQSVTVTYTLTLN